MIKVPESPLALLIAETEEPYLAASEDRLSPFLTVWRTTVGFGLGLALATVDLGLVLATTVLDFGLDEVLAVERVLGVERVATAVEVGLGRGLDITGLVGLGALEASGTE